MQTARRSPGGATSPLPQYVLPPGRRRCAFGQGRGPAGVSALRARTRAWYAGSAWYRTAPGVTPRRRAAPATLPRATARADRTRIGVSRRTIPGDTVAPSRSYRPAIRLVGYGRRPGGPPASDAGADAGVDPAKNVKKPRVDPLNPSDPALPPLAPTTPSAYASRFAYAPRARFSIVVVCSVKREGSTVSKNDYGYLTRGLGRGPPPARGV